MKRYWRYTNNINLEDGSALTLHDMNSIIFHEFVILSSNCQQFPQSLQDKSTTKTLSQRDLDDDSLIVFLFKLDKPKR